MKKLLTLLAIIGLLSSCRKNNTANFKYCWMCNIEGYYNGRLVDIDSSICEKTETEIRQFESGYNQNGKVIVCTQK